MENHPSESDVPASIAERLREQFEQIRASLEQKGGPQAREKLLADRAKLLRRRAAVAEPTTAPLLFLAFSRGSRRYGIPLESVQEVQALEQFSPVPGAPAGILGVVHWRGAILALLDLSKWFEIAEIGLSDLHAYIVVESAGKRLAIAASQVDDVVAVPVDRLKGAPELPPRIAPEWIVGVHNENQLILKMDEIFKSLQGGAES
jgi:purine-binding chemotaxis protein CheW